MPRQETPSCLMSGEIHREHLVITAITASAKLLVLQLSWKVSRLANDCCYRPLV